MVERGVQVWYSEEEAKVSIQKKADQRQKRRGKRNRKRKEKEKEKKEKENSQLAVTERGRDR